MNSPRQSPKFCMLLLATAAMLHSTPATEAAIQLAVTPETIRNDYGGLITLQIAGVTSGQSVIIEKFLDLNGNAAIDTGEPLVQRLAVTDGQVTTIGGIRNRSVPGDEDGQANGQLRIDLQILPEDHVARFAASFIYRVSAAEGVTTKPLRITQPNPAQGITGTIAGGAGAVLILLSSDLADDDTDLVAGTVADAAGQFAFTTEPGTYLLLALKSGFVATFESAPVITVGSNEIIFAQIPLGEPATRTVQGRVVDSSGAAVAGLTLFMESEEGEAVLTFTDADGNFTAAVSPGEWYFEADSPTLAQIGCVGLDDEIEADTRDGNVNGLNVVVPKGDALLYGRVTGPLGNGMAGIELEFQGNGGDTLALTHEDGSYSVAVTAGTWRIWVENEGPEFEQYVAPSQIYVSVAAGQTLETQIAFRAVTAHITGRLETSLGQPVAGIEVFATHNDGGVWYQSRADTDEEGRYSLGVFSGTWTVQVDSGDLRERGYGDSTTATVTINGTDQVADLIVSPPSAYLRGRVIDDTGAPVADIRLLAIRGFGPDSDSDTSETGSFEIGVSPGSWRLQLESDDADERGLIGPSLSFEVSDGVDINDIEYVVRRTDATIIGSVKTSQGQGIGGLYISAHSTINGEDYNSMGDNRTDASGNFSLRVFNGSWQVGVDSSELTDRGYAPIGNQVVPVSNGSGTVEFTVQSFSAHVAGQVVDDTGAPVAFIGLRANPLAGGAGYGGTTDGNGMFRIGVSGGSWSLDLDPSPDIGAASRGLVSPRLPFTVVAGTDQGGIVMVAKRSTGQIVVTLQDSQSQPIPGVQVFSESTFSETNYLARAQTDSSGQAVLQVFNGSWDVWFNNWDLEMQGYNPVPSQDPFLISDGSLSATFVASRSGEEPPPSGFWSVKAPMPTARFALGAEVIDGILYVVGGQPSASEAYDPAQNTWSTRAPMLAPRVRIATGVIDGKLYVAGGATDGARLDVYDPAADTWSQRRSMAVARLGAAAGVIDGKLYVAGGTSDFTRTLEVYDPGTDTWTVKAPMPTPRMLLGAAVIDGLLYTVGGANAVFGGSALDVLEVYDPATDSWTTKAPMPTGRSDLAAAAMNGRLYAAGGFSGGTQFESYDPGTDRWTVEAPMPTGRGDLALGVLGNKLFAVGGTSNPGQANFATLEQFQTEGPDTTVTLTLKSDASTLGASLGAGAPSAAVLAKLDAGDTAGLNFVPVVAGAFGTGTPIPSGAPSGTMIVNLAPGDGQNGFFKVTFSLPEAFHAIQLIGSANVDDFGRAFLNGTPISPPLLSSEGNRITQFGNAQFSSSDPGLFRPGLNELLIADLNAGGGPSGAGFYALVAYEPGAASIPATLSSPEVTSDGRFEFTLSGLAGRSYQVQFSTDLNVWIDLDMVTLTTGSQRYEDNAAAGSSHRFYRVIEAAP